MRVPVSGLSVDSLSQGTCDLSQQGRFAGGCHANSKFTGMHPAIEEDRQTGAGAFRDAGNKARDRRDVCAIDPTQRFSGNRTAILEVADGDRLSLVHGRSCLLMAGR
jgi:hypothetical protein